MNDPKEIKRSKKKVATWDICRHFHGMSDMGWDNEKNTYSRHHTYTGECYADRDGKLCKRRGICVKARRK